jgi:hypothetical protein
MKTKQKCNRCSHYVKADDEYFLRDIVTINADIDNISSLEVRLGTDIDNRETFQPFLSILHSSL